MDFGGNNDDTQRLEEITGRIRDLESELISARASLVTLRSRLLITHPQGMLTGFHDMLTSPATPFSALPNSGVSGEGDKVDDFSLIVIEPLSEHDPLRRKWRLERGLPEGDVAIEVASLYSDSRVDGYVRLFGLLQNGQPWEVSLPFADLVKEGGITIGRDPEECTLALPESSVSRCHVRLEITSLGLSVTDLGSMNGVRVNDELISSYTPYAPLVDGMTLSLGEIVLRVEVIQMHQETKQS